MPSMHVAVDPGYIGIASASSARTASGTSGNIQLLGSVRYVAATINITAQSGTSPTVIWYAQASDANGVMTDLFTRAAAAAPVAATQIRMVFGPDCPNISFAAPTAAGVVSTVSAPAIFDPNGNFLLGWTIAGTTPSVTFQYSVQLHS